MTSPTRKEEIKRWTLIPEIEEIYFQILRISDHNKENIYCIFWFWCKCFSTTAKDSATKLCQFKDTICYLSCDVLPSRKIRSRRIVNKSEDHTFIEDILLSKVRINHRNVQLGIPESLIHILELHHITTLSGHQEVMRTYIELNRKFYFRNI